MIYLLRSYGISSTVLTTGYARCIKKRLDIYHECNPFVKLIGLRKGSKQDSAFLHRYLKTLGYTLRKDGKLIGWFEDRPEIIDAFNNPPRDIEIPETEEDRELEDILWEYEKRS